MTVRVRAFKDGMTPSVRNTGFYTLGAPTTTVAHLAHTHQVRILPLDRDNGHIVHGRRTWLVVHGWGSYPGRPNIQELAAAMASQGGAVLNDEQVLFADWRQLSTIGNLVDNTHIQLAAQGFVQLLNGLNIKGETLNIVGHSHGAYVGEAIKNALGVNRFIALDPATVGDGFEDARFRDNANWSWAFYGSLAGSLITSRTAHESFVLQWPQLLPGCCPNLTHNQTVFVYAELVRSAGFGGHFLPSRMRLEDRPWSSNRYNWLGNPSADRQFEAVISAQSGSNPGWTAQRVCYFRSTDEMEFCSQTMAAASEIVYGAPVGACCVGAACTTNVLEADCAGIWSADNSCDAKPGLRGSFCCAGNFNRDSVKDAVDALTFLNAWFAADPAAEWNGDGAFDSGDVFEFLTDWFAPC